MLKNKKLSEEQRTKWLKVMRTEVMSSEESDVDGNGDEVLHIRPLPWRSSEVNRMFAKIDTYIMAGKSPASKRQLKKKSQGEVSSRHLSAEIRGGLPDFAVDHD